MAGAAIAPAVSYFRNRGVQHEKERKSNICRRMLLVYGEAV
jgi:hypothetical protein